MSVSGAAGGSTPVLALVVWLLSGASSLADVPAAVIERTGVEAQRLSLHNFAGALTIVTAERADIALGLVAPSEMAEGLDLTVSDGALVLRFRPSSQVQLRTVGQLAPRLTAEPQSHGIDVLDASPFAEFEPAQLLVLAPLESNIAIDGLVGNARIGAIDGDLELTLINGNAAATRARDASLTLAGGGQITLDFIDRSLDLRLLGAGSIDVASGNAELVDAILSGSGSVAFGGVSDAARLAGEGAGTIELGPVSGSLAIDVGPAVLVSIEGR